MPRGKQPAIKGGFHAATTNPETIERLLAAGRSQHRHCDRRADRASGCWTLTVTIGAASLAALEAKHGPLPPTRTVISGGGGRHFWFRYRGPIPSTAGRIAPGLDTRGDGAYVIVPPSVHPNGRRYEFVSYDRARRGRRNGWSGSPAPGRSRFPNVRSHRSERGVRTIVRPDAYGRAALDREIASLAAALPGTRNNALNCAAFKLFQLVAGGELDDDQVVERPDRRLPSQWSGQGRRAGAPCSPRSGARAPV